MTLYVWVREIVFEAKCSILCTKDLSSLPDLCILRRSQFQNSLFLPERLCPSLPYYVNPNANRHD